MMITQLRHLRLLLFFVVIFPGLALADKDVISHWLDRMSQASQELSYKGRFVHSRDGNTSLLEIVHVVTPDGSRERIVSLSGEDQELIRDQHGNVFLMNLGPPLLIDSGSPDIPLAVRIQQNLESVLKNYYFELGAADRVAGRKTQIVSILPRDQQRYSYRLWVDSQTGFLIRSELVGEQNEILEHIMFSDIELMQEASEELLDAVLHDRDLLAKSEALNATKPIGSPGQSDVWQVVGKPSGFWRTNNDESFLLSAKKSVVYLMLTDGLASVSIYIEPLKNHSKVLQGASSSGALSAYGRVLDKHQITVVGEVPPVTVKEIGDAVTRSTMSLNAPSVKH